MKFSVVFLLSTILFFSCQKELTFSEVSYSNEGCQGDYDCVEIKLNLVEANNLKKVSDSINLHLFRLIKDMMTFSEDAIDTSTVYKTLISNYQKAFYFTKSELNNDKMKSWEFTCTASVQNDDQFFVNLKVDHYQFTGGAHGYNASQSILIDKVNGKKLSVDKMFTNHDIVKRKIEMIFREQFDIPFGKSLNEFGFFFENDQFKLPENIFFGDDLILFVYNPYEIAPYSSGIITLEVKRQTLDKYLQINQFEN